MPNSIKKGGKLYISSEDVTADLDLAGYEALNWVEVGGLINLPAFGITSNMVSRDLLDDEVTSYQKGYGSAGQPDFEVAPDGDDLGQIELLEVGATTYRFGRGFKLESNDALNATGTNTFTYTRGKVTGPRLNGGGGEDFDTHTYTIGCEQAPVIDKATAGV